MIDTTNKDIEESKVKITFGLQEHHLKRIDEERVRWNNIEITMTETVDMIYATHFWEKLGKEFGWHPFSLALYYFQYLNDFKLKQI